jgi:Cysteine-rich secretory protein family
MSRATATQALARALWLALAVPSSARAQSASSTWAAATMSPDPIGPAGLDALERTVLEKCGPGERGLRETAASIVAIKASGLPMPELGAIAFAQRAAGEPHPWARAWAMRGRNLGGPTSIRALDAWLAADKATLRRCGVASGAAEDGARVLVVVSVDALADLAPLPTRARVGQWLTIEARMRVRAYGAKVLVVGPTGLPREILASFEGGRLRARFAPDVPGQFAIQVIAEIESGPRPVLEASVFADALPTGFPSDTAAPGEDASTGGSDDITELAAMVSAARAWAGLSPLARDPRLDEVARGHALAMAEEHALAHDVGEGGPMERLHAAGLSAGDVGENVAHAATVALAHRVMWASPSHRAEMLRHDFERMGIGVAKDERGDAWVVEVFTAHAFEVGP